MTRRPAVLLTLFLTLLASGCGRADGDTASSSPTPAANATAAPGLPTAVNELPTTDVAGFNALMDELVGTPVVVNVWASWCEPCKAETPLLVRAAEDHPEVQFLGVDVKDSRGGATSFLGTFGVTYPSLFDPPGAIQTELGMLGPPATFFYDASGRQVFRSLGLLSQEALDAGLAQIRN